MARNFYVGVDVGGTKIVAALTDRKGRILSREKTPTPRGVKPKQILKVIGGLIKSVVAQHGLRLKDILGVGIGAPGIIDPKGRRVVSAPNISLSGYALADKLFGVLGVEVRLGNDVNLGVLGERWLGGAKGAANLVGIFPGTGVGGGVIVGGRMLLGAHGAAAELGHLIVEPGGPFCGCGNRGCLEALASRSAIERDIRRARGTRDKSPIKSKVLAKGLKRKDKIITGVMRRASEHLGSACVSLRHTFDPELFLFGGGLIEACGAFILPIVQKALDADPFFKKVGRCRVVASKLGDDATILGAVALVRRP
jgi:glucokinase